MSALLDVPKLGPDAIDCMISMSFDPRVARLVGTDAAIILSNIELWQAGNRANGKHCHDGVYWVYSSVSAFAELFPYLSESQIQRNLKKLEDAGFVQAGNFNSSRFNRAKWYSSSRANRSIDKEVVG